MPKMNEENERIKRNYFIWMREAEGRDVKTISKIAAAINRYEQSTNYKALKKFHIDDAIRFKADLRKAKNERTNKPLSHSTIDSTLRIVEAFVRWLASQQGYKSRISYADARYFKNTLKDARIAHTHRPMQYPTLLQCERAFGGMPERTIDERRDKAGFAFLMLTGGRVKAVSTLRLKHINIEDSRVFMDAREVETKNAKTINTAFYPVDQIYYAYFESWVKHLYEVELFGPEDPLFPKPKMGVTKEKGFKNLGLSREAYSSTSKLYHVVKSSFSNVQMPAYTPHNFRRTHGVLFSKYCKTGEQMNAWRLNFGHEDLMTMFRSYMPISEARQFELIAEMREGGGRSKGESLEADATRDNPRRT